MSHPAQQLLGELSRYGLLFRTTPDDALRSLELDDRSDEHLVVSKLVDSGHLTEFQAREIRAGQIPNLLVDQYVILDKLGEGGMGVVFKARHKLMDRLVAIKLLTPKLSCRPDLARRFHREIKTQSKLAHPSIVAAFDAGEVRGSLYLVMEYVDGDNLADLVRLRGPFSPREALHLVRQAAIGLGFAHRVGIVHRDIKPQNLLVDRAGRLKILDFGLARLNFPWEFDPASSDSGDDSPNPARDLHLARQGMSELTMAGQIMGTVDYMAPEQVLDSRSVDGRSDIYSLGCTLHFLLSGRIVFPGNSAIEKVLAHRESPVPSLAAFLSGFPPAFEDQLDGVFRRMVAKARTDRFETAEELAGALKELQIVLDQGFSTVRGQPGGAAESKDRNSAGPVRRTDRSSAKPDHDNGSNPPPARTDRVRSDGTARPGSEAATPRSASPRASSVAKSRPTRPLKTPVSNPLLTPADEKEGDDDRDDEPSTIGLEPAPPFWTQTRIVALTLAVFGAGSVFALFIQHKSADVPTVIESSADIVPDVDGSGDQKNGKPTPASGNLKRKFKL